MIERIKRLDLDGFRGFRSTATIPMDADVVLIFGENGTGKSSVLSALEYAITGSVRDLARFSADYPRSLAHVERDEPPEVRLTIQTKNGDERTLSSGRSEEVPEQARRHFVSHSYLSQSRLHTLLTSYSEADEEDSEARLSKFIREILGLGMLDALTDGLYEAGDIRRLRGAVPEYDELRMEIDRVQTSLEGTQSRLTGVASELEDSLDEAVQMLAQLWDQVPRREEIDTAAIREILSRIRAETGGGTGKGALERLKKAEGLVDRATVVLTEPPEAIEPPSALRERLDEAERKAQELEDDLRQLVERGKKSLGLSERLPDDSIQALRRLERLVREDIERLEYATDTRGRLLERRKQLQDRIDELQSVVEQYAKRDLTQQEEWADTLSRVLDHIDNDICPVCGRDYTEVAHGESLQAHVRDELQQLEAEVETARAATQQRLAREAELAETEVQFGVVEERIETLGVPDDAEKVLTARHALEEALASSGPARTDLEDLRAQMASWEDNISRSAEWYQQRARTMDALVSLGADLGVDVEEETPPDRLLDRVRNAVAELRNKSLQTDARRSALAEALEHTLAISLQYDDLSSTLDQKRTRLQSLTKAADQVSSLAGDARQIRDITAEVKADLVRTVFTRRLNDLWNDLFTRMVRNEWFLPELGVEPLGRGRLRTTMRATPPPGSEVGAFSHLESVLSAGNLNTAALSLFLALNLLQEPVNRLLVLDDPVQSMDDLHAVELANVLRLIARQGDRQLVVAIHEEPLLDYLQVELGPTKPGQSLITARLEREGNTATVTVDREEYEEDQLRVVPA